ncbi:MAG: hypothetical protein JO275_02920 [Verrucomicrobia bacterium]|nr:hypothetical protein [Verrucomicrobiota bacterium]
MKRIQFSMGTDPGVAEVLSPFSGQVPRVHRFAAADYPKSIVLFPGSRPQLMRVPQLGYSLETLAFAVCGAASLALMLITVLGVN